MFQSIQTVWRYLHPPPEPSQPTSRSSNEQQIKMSTAGKQEVSQMNEYAQKWSKNKKAEYEFVDRMLQNKKEFTAKCKFEGYVTVGSGFSKTEAKRISAGNMLALLYEIDPSKFDTAPKTTSKKVEEEPVMISNKLEDFDSAKLDIFLDKYLDTREKDYSKFRRLFVGDMPENTENQFQVNDEFLDVKSAKSKTLEKLKITGISVVNMENACRLFKAIVQEMNLIYYAEFLETANNDRYAVVIKVNLNLFTTGGIGDSPEKAIQTSCQNAIEFLFFFNS